MSIELLPEFLRTHYEVHEWRHAIAILRDDFPNEWQDIIEVLTSFRLLKSHIRVGEEANPKLLRPLIQHSIFVAGQKKPSIQKLSLTRQKLSHLPTK